MKVKQIYMETDDKGKHKVIEYTSGIKVRYLREPSEAYKKKQEKNRQKAQEQERKEKEQMEIRQKIAEKQKELAIQNLLDSGELTKDDLNKIGHKK